MLLGRSGDWQIDANCEHAENQPSARHTAAELRTAIVNLVIQRRSLAHRPLRPIRPPPSPPVSPISPIRRWRWRSCVAPRQALAPEAGGESIGSRVAVHVASSWRRSSSGETQDAARARAQIAKIKPRCLAACRGLQLPLSVTPRHCRVNASPMTGYRGLTSGAFFCRLSLRRSSARTPGRDVSPPGTETRPMPGAVGRGTA